MAAGSSSLAELEHCIGFSPESIHVHPEDPSTLVYSIGKLVVISSLNDRHNQRFLRGHTGEVTALSVSDNGSLIASGERCSNEYQQGDVSVIVWDFASGSVVRQFSSGVRNHALCVSFSPDGKLVACSEAPWYQTPDKPEQRLFVWDVTNGELTAKKRVTKAIKSLSWCEMRPGKSARNPTYTLFASYGSAVTYLTLEFSLKLMQYEVNVQEFAYPRRGLGTREYLCCASSHDGRFIACGTQTGHCLVFSTEHMSLRKQLPAPSHGVTAVTFLREKGSVVCGGGDGQLRRFCGADVVWHETGCIQLSGRIVSISVPGSDESTAIVATSAGKVYRIQFDDFSASLVSEAHTSDVLAVAFGAEKSDIFASASSDGKIIVWDLNTYLALSRANGDTACLCLAFDSTTSIVAGFESGHIRSFAIAENGRENRGSAQNQQQAHFDVKQKLYTHENELWSLMNAHRGGVHHVAVTDVSLVSTGADGTLRVWSKETRSILGNYPAHSGSVAAVVPDVRGLPLLHSCGEDKSILTFDTNKKIKVSNHMIRNGTITAMCQKKEREYELLTTTTDGRILVWDEDVPERPVHEIQYEDRPSLNAIVGAPVTGHHFAVAGANGFVSIHRANGKYDIVSTCVGHSGEVKALTWSPDERQIVSGGRDTSICVWNFYGES